MGIVSDKLQQEMENACDEMDKKECTNEEIQSVALLALYRPLTEIVGQLERIAIALEEANNIACD